MSFCFISFTRTQNSSATYAKGSTKLELKSNWDKWAISANETNLFQTVDSARVSSTKSLAIPQFQISQFKFEGNCKKLSFILMHQLLILCNAYLSRQLNDRKEEEKDQALKISERGTQVVHQSEELWFTQFRFFWMMSSKEVHYASL